MGKRKNFRTAPSIKRHVSGAKKQLSFGLLHIRIAIIAALFVALSSQLFFFNRLAVQGEELRNLEEKKSQLTQQKTSLEQETVQLSSLSRIDRESRVRLGMVESDKNVHYVTPEKMASLR